MVICPVAIAIMNSRLSLQSYISYHKRQKFFIKIIQRAASASYMKIVHILCYMLLAGSAWYISIYANNGLK